ncbi:uncharacterized protein FIBRA_00482 [Fibroporia radiculosa]|uniref:Uncharacterized protein n=1 Tax=Fibroporia radiculosa TaxID=599839 RepID=J4H028_9APHY|nr:uncharacterized protein FIBRA_00482 [Fibroporia radiculosa]CCL98484.1 predicted protein [Fibroporia radiculosa]
MTEFFLCRQTRHIRARYERWHFVVPTQASLILSYLQFLTLVSSRRAEGDSLVERSLPASSFSAPERGLRGSGAGDRIDVMVEARVVLEKIKVLEGRTRYEIDKLVRVAEEAPSAAQNVVNGKRVLAKLNLMALLAFRPNPQVLMDRGSGSEDDEDGRPSPECDGIYRPPKLAPVLYAESHKDKGRSRRAPIPNTLSTLLHLGPSKPHMESTCGLGSTPDVTASARSAAHDRVRGGEHDLAGDEKRDARRRKQDEADLALGGIGTASGRRGRGGGFEDEFVIFLSPQRGRNGTTGDGYEAKGT